MKEIHFSFVFVLAYSYLCAYIFDLKSRIIEKERQICTAFQKPCVPGVPMPKVENFCGGVQVMIDRTQFMKMMNGGSSVTSNVVSDVGSLSVAQLTERQRKILELIRKDSFISAQQMSVVLSVVKRTIERDLAGMQKKGVLIREGNTSAGHWIVLTKE